MKFAAFALFLVLSSPAQAFETDNFSLREELRTKPDATEMMDEEVISRIQAATTKFNENGSCKEDLNRPLPKIFDYISDVMGGNFSLGIHGFATGVEEFAEDDQKLQRYRIGPPNPSIYAHGGKFISIVGVQPSLRMGGHMVGVDKFGHFFSQGKEYFQMVYLHHQDPSISNLFNVFNHDDKIPFKQRNLAANENEVKPALYYGIDLEEGGFGLTTTGVKSYGDMSANFEGMRFWASLLGGKQPYLSCVGNHYQLNPNRAFTFGDYIHAGWDEGINCSEFEHDFDSQYRAAIAKKGGCPLLRSECKEIAQQPCSEYYLSPACNTSGSRPTQTCEINASILQNPATHWTVPEDACTVPKPEIGGLNHVLRQLKEKKGNKK